jgi:hypothetical protein
MERTRSGSSLLCLPRSPATKRKIVAVRMGQVWYCTAMDVAQQQGRRTRPPFQVAQTRAAPVERVLDNSVALVDTRFIALFKFRHIRMKKIMIINCKGLGYFSHSRCSVIIWARVRVRVRFGGYIYPSIVLVLCIPT